MRNDNIDRITAQEAMELLRKDGINVDIEQAKIIAAFLYEMAELVVNTYLYQQKNVNLPTLKKSLNQV
ncbi:hypothetical protein AAEO57_09685 [Flavobacterium sp. DGU38]|uniref:Uncharacterized protein n=1 Tax=Flavobacterium calami TaxID=3139144 RepID=A0ABU9INL9_9FLAO